MTHKGISYFFFLVTTVYVIPEKNIICQYTF